MANMVDAENCISRTGVSKHMWELHLNLKQIIPNTIKRCKKILPYIFHHPLADTLKQFEERRDQGTLKRQSTLMKASAAHMMWQLDRGVANVASAVSLTDDVTVTNHSNVFNSNFYPDLSFVFMTAELVNSQPAAYL